MKVPITKVGEKCRHCDGRVIEAEHKPGFKPRPMQPFYFKRWLKCPKCHAIYHMESEKVYTSPEAEARFKELARKRDAWFSGRYSELDRAIEHDRD